MRKLEQMLKGRRSAKINIEEALDQMEKVNSK